LLELTFLTPLSIRLDSQPLKLPTRRTEALLVYLIRNRQTHARDVLAYLFWDDLPQSKAQGNLRVLLANLRKELAPYIIITRQTVAFNAQSAHRLDVDGLETVLAAAREEIDRTGAIARMTATTLGEALLVYQGELLPGFFLRGGQGFEEWLATEREWLWTRVVEALDDLATEHLQQGDYRAGIAQAQRLVNLDPLREEGHQLLMQLWAAEGQLSAALAQYDRCVEILARELNVPPHPFTTELSKRMRAGAWQLPRGAKATPGGFRQPVPHTLPRPMTPFWGRTTEIAHLATLLRDPATPLITIAGPGGVGKTALAIEAARQWVEAERLGPEGADTRPHFADGIYFVALGAVSTGSGIAPATAEAVGYHFQKDTDDEIAQLLHYVRDKAMLLVLDNAEHLLNDTDFFGRLLAAPHVKLLITSRHKLNRHGETAVMLDGLDFPSPAAVAELDGAPALHATLLQFSAVRLFIETIRRGHGNITLRDKDIADIARICQLVQGIPLALLLAAAWIELFSPAEIAAEIERNVAFLTIDAAHGGADHPVRQHSMQAVFDHSWALLTRDEQQTLARMSIFHSGCTRRVAQEVTAGSLRELLSLVHKSLLVRDVAAERFTIHELLRQMASAKLHESGEPAAPLHRLAVATVEQLYAQHLALYASELAHHAEQAGMLDKARGYWRLAGDTARDLYQNVLALEQYGRALQLTGDDDLEMAFQLRRERQAINHLLGRRAQQASELAALHDLAAALRDARKQSDAAICQARYAEATGNYADAAHAAHLAVALAETAGAGDLQALGNLAWGVALSRGNDFDAARERLEAAVRFAEASSLPLIAADSLRNLGIDAVYQGRPDLARRYFAENLEIYRQLNNRPGEAAGLGNLGALALHQCDYHGAQSFLAESVAIFRQMGDRRSEAIGLNNLGVIAHKLGEGDVAEQCIAQALRIATAIDDQQSCREAHNLLGHFLLDQSRRDEAKGHYTQALQLARMLESGGHVLESQVGLASIALAEGDAAAALLLLGDEWEHIDEALLAQTEDIVRLYWSIYRILIANHAARADVMLAAACSHLQGQVAQIADPDARQAFLVISIHRALGEVCTGGDDL
jgi:DNA-binding SARP family transcriptional activator/predicted ATPase